MQERKVELRKARIVRGNAGQVNQSVRVQKLYDVIPHFIKD
jgi:hypothetical protein